MRMKKISIVVLLIMASLFSAPASNRNEPLKELKPDKNFPLLAQRDHFKELKLTAEQNKRLNDRRKDRSKKMQGERSEMMKAHKALMDELDKEYPNHATLQRHKQTILDLESDRIDAMIENVTELKEVLTKEQYKKLNEFRQKQYKKDFGRHNSHDRK